MERVDTVVIGAGAIGAAVAYELVAFGVNTLVLESAPGPAAGQSGAGTGIVDTGYAAEPGSVESSLVLTQGRRWPEIFDQLNILYRVCGAVLIASDSGQLQRLGQAEKLAGDNGVKTKAYDRGQIRNIEPQAKAVGGLLIPGEAITDPYDVVAKLLGAGPALRYGSRVRAVEPAAESAVVRCESGDVEARFVVNCAGLFAAEIAADSSFALGALRGEGIVFPHEAAMLTDHIILPLPIEGDPRATVFPTIHGQLCAMAEIGEQPGKADWSPRPQDAVTAQRTAARLIPRLAEFAPIESWTALRATARSGHLVAEWSKRVPRMYTVAAPASTGLSVVFGLSAYVVDRCRERGLPVKARSGGAARPVRAAEPAIAWWKRRR